MIRSLWITFLLLILLSSVKGQDILLGEKGLIEKEKQAFIQTQTFKENSSYKKTDFIYQRMEWEVDPAVRYISGRVTSYFKSNIEHLDSIQIDLHRNMGIDSITRNAETLGFSHANNKISIFFPEPIHQGKIDSFSVYYHGIPTSSGFGSFETNVHGENQTPVLWTLSEPYGAMEWWPCKQSLTDKIDSIDVIVTTPLAYKTASNGILVKNQIVGDKRIMHWKHRHPIATYLIAIAVTNYAVYSDTLFLDDNRTIDILNYVYPENLDAAKSQTPVTAEIMELYNELIGEYPFANEKYGHAQFGRGGGMEHQTMSFMGSFSFMLISHELAHQWFGDYITLGSWQDIWLNEGFATYLNALSYEHLLPDKWPVWKKTRAESIMSSPGGSVFVTDTTSVGRIFNTRLSYHKGAYLLHMLRWVLGDDNFFAGIRSYFNDPEIANGFATTDQLIQHLETAGDTTLQEFFEDWYYGEGNPIYTLKYEQQDNNEVTIELSQTTSHSSVDFFEMPVPVRLYNADRTQSADFRLNNTHNNQNFTVNPGFEVAAIEFDPDYWLLSKHEQVVDVHTIKLGNIIVYPNPAHNKIFISLPSETTIVSAKLYSLDGTIVKRFSGQLTRLDIHQLSAGIYTLLLETNNGIYTDKIVKTN